MKLHIDDQDDSGITAQAARWWTLLKETRGPELPGFEAWLRASPRHVEEFLFIAAAEREFERRLRPSPVDVPALLARARASDNADNVVLLPGSLVLDEPEPPVRTRARWLAAAAVAGLAVASWWAFETYPRWYGYSTVLGEQRAFELDDGSVIHLNTQSRVKVHFTAAGRDVELLAGEALFRVAREARRPFRVHVRGGVIQALGTQFNVYRGSQRTTVSVIEGLVRISQEGNAPPGVGVRAGASAPVPGAVSISAAAPPVAVPQREATADIFAAGQGASITLAGEITRREGVDTVQVSAWRQRRLVFRGERLEEVAAEFNRYNHAPKIAVEGEHAANKQMAGVFDADDPESLLLFLSQYGDLTVERTGERVVIRSRESI